MEREEVETKRRQRLGNRGQLQQPPRRHALCLVFVLVSLVFRVLNQQFVSLSD